MHTVSVEVLPHDYILELAKENIQINTARGLKPVPLHLENGSMRICGNGPSLRDEFPLGHRIAALNGAWRQLAKRGTTPEYIIAYDPAPENVAWFEDAPRGAIYLLGSRMDPGVFDMLIDYPNVYIWHLLADQERSLGLEPLIGGGNTVGTVAPNLLAAMGYEHFDIYGCDSCWGNDGAHHAVEQSWAIEPPKVYQIGERPWLASPWMIAQMEKMLELIRENRIDYSVKIHGDSLMAAAVEQNTLDIYYDLDAAPGSFDFIYSLFNAVGYAKGREYSNIRLQFRNDGIAQKPQDPIQLSHAHKSNMLNNVVRPLVQMFGIEEVEHVKDDALHFHYSPRRSLEYYRETKFIPKFRENRAARKWARDNFTEPNIITITLREADYWPQRNSSMKEWLKFADWVRADHRIIFLRDTGSVGQALDFETCDEASLDLHKRLALYRRARMNFFVMNGPASLAFMTRGELPYAVFFKDAPGYACYDPEWLQSFIGIDPYGQMPWADLYRQRLVYKDDKFLEIMKVYKELLT